MIVHDMTQDGERKGKCLSDMNSTVTWLLSGVRALFASISSPPLFGYDTLP